MKILHYIYISIFVVICFLSFLAGQTHAQMMCCNGCYGGVCQAQANCVFGGQTCSNECSGQGASCGNICTYDNNCPFYPSEVCVGGSCVDVTPTPIPNSPMPTPTTFVGSCPYCSNPKNSKVSSCTSCYASTPGALDAASLGWYTVYAGQNSGGWYVWNTYACNIRISGTSCGSPYVFLYRTMMSPNPDPAPDWIIGLDGCWPSGCGPYPVVDSVPNITPTPSPTRTPTPSPTLTPTPTLGCNSSCPGNGYYCGNDLWCAGGLVGNKCRNAACPGIDTCTCFPGSATTPPTPTPICGDKQCEASECSTCNVDCAAASWCASVPTPTLTPSHTFTANPNPCTMISTEECTTTISWNTTNYSNVTVETNTATISHNLSGSQTVTLGTINCVTYYLKSNGITITSETVCPQRRWIKLKNASYQTRASYLVNPIPDTVQAYDADDTTQPQFIIGEAGSVTARSITPYPTTVSSPAWVKEDYTPRIIMDKSKILSYVKSRKEYIQITSSEMPTIQSGKVYYVTDSTLTITNTSPFDGKNVVIIVDGTITFDIAGGFIPTNGHVAFIANTINLYSGANYISTINALLIADTVSTGSVDNTGLKIVGNLITKSLMNDRTQSGSSNTKPSIFISVDPQTYLSLLPLISTAKYEWKQLN